MLKKSDKGLFGNPSRKIEVASKVLFVITAILGAVFFIIGLTGVLTWMSYGWSDEDFMLGVIRMVVGVFLVIGAYWVTSLAIGFSRIVASADYEAFLDEELFDYEQCGDYADEYEDQCDGSCSQGCQGCDSVIEIE
ncbi:MAG: hypothetical protein PHH48_03790 [Eubacteriales bacterium]|nr:hypothetical protein [Eubacteriales bacterium]